MTQAAPPKGVPLRATGCSPWEVVVPTDELAEVLRPALAKLNHELNFAEWETEQSRLGATQIVAERCARWLGIRVDSIPRRIYGILNGEFRSCTVRHADAFLLALDINIGDTDIAHLPHGRPAAYEMVEAYHKEVLGVRPRRKDVDELVRKLLRFKTGYLQHEKLLAEAESKLESEQWIAGRIEKQLELEEVAA
jgi:hypothetical protein